MRRVNFFDRSGYVILSQPYAGAIYSAADFPADVVMTGDDSVVMTLFKDEDPLEFSTQVILNPEVSLIEHGYFRFSQEGEIMRLLLPHEIRGYMLSFVSNGYYSHVSDYSLSDGRKVYVVNFYDHIIAHLIVPKV